MFGHVLGLPEGTPVRRVLEFVRCYVLTNIVPEKKRHCTNMLSVLRSDVKEEGPCALRLRENLREIKTFAKDNTQW